MTVVRARPTRRLSGAACALAFGLAALLTSCGGNENIIYGTAVISVGGTNQGFSAYLISVDEITLTRNDGLIIEPLATPELFDFSKLQNSTEVLTGAAVPVGTYTSMSLVIDYTTPTIYVDVNGVPTAAAPLDNTGVPMLSESLTVNFDPANPLVINNSVSTRLAILFDLAAFNTINTGTSPLNITVQPYVVATPLPEDSTPLRVRGLLVTTQAASSNFIVDMRPFYDLVSELGAFTIATSPTTYFNINGVTYTGAAGLAAVGALQESTALAAYGTLGDLSGITPTLNATAVYGGTSLESPLADYFTGVVSARSDDTLTLLGASFNSRLGLLQYYPSMPITIGTGTIVSEDGAAVGGLNAQSVSVGQQITVSGQASVNTSNGVASSMDATQGQVRLAPTPVWGTLNSAAAGTLSMNVATLGGFESGAFHFAGTGATSADDASAASYSVRHRLDQCERQPGRHAAPDERHREAVRFRAPGFRGERRDGGQRHPAAAGGGVGLGRLDGTVQALNSAGIVVNLTSTHIDAIHYIATGPQKLDLTTLPASPTIAFASGTPLILSVGNDTLISAFNSVSSFITAVNTQLNGTNAIYRLVCVGQYDSATNTFTASRVTWRWKSRMAATHTGLLRHALETAPIHRRRAGARARHRGSA